MATNSGVRNAPLRSNLRSAFMALPMAAWGLLMMTPGLGKHPSRAEVVAALAVVTFMTWLFFMMMRTGRTYRWRRYFFVALGFLFPVGFIYALVQARGTMSIPLERMIGGDTPFCHMVIPMIILPAALTRSIIFPGSVLPSASNPHAMGTMIAIWLGATLVLGKAWCAYGCFFGGIEEGFAAFPPKAKIRKIDPRWRYVPWAVLLGIVLLSAALFEPVYCMWLCPFKAVTEYPEVHNLESAIQAVIFSALFLGLVIVLPLLTKKRTQCAFFCPFGAFQSLFEKINIFRIHIRRDKCADCILCRNQCPTLALSAESVQKGETLLSCMRCGACVDSCPRQAAVWHIKGTSPDAKPERARLLFLYGAWMFAMMFGGSTLANGVYAVLKLAGRLA